MLSLPASIVAILAPFAHLFNARTWQKAQVVLIGAILSPGKRTVTAALRIMSLHGDATFARYHQVLNRAVWSPRRLAQCLLMVLLHYLDSGIGPLIFGIDETLERRRGERIKAKGIYRDPVRSSKSHFVKASGLRWVCLTWLAFIPWARRTWALPFLTVLAPSERYYQKQGKTPKKLSDWARQMVLQLRRWLPNRYLVLVGDSTYAVLELLHFCQSLPNPVTFITRLRLDAGLYEPAPPRHPGQKGRPRVKGKRLPTLKQLLQEPSTTWERVTVNWYDCTQRILEIVSDTAVWYHSGLPPVPIRWVLVRDPLGELETQAFLCTDLLVTPTQVIEWFVLRWQMEVTFQEVRTHLGVETQRQWSDSAIARTTPILLGLFSWITLAAHLLQGEHSLLVRTAAWYVKPLPTFSDTIAFVRLHLWPMLGTFLTSPREDDMVKLPRLLVSHLVESLSYTA